MSEQPAVTGPKITIDLEAVFGSTEEFSLRDAIIVEAANRIVGDMQDEIRGALRERVSRVDEIAREEITSYVRTALAGTIQRHSYYGEKVGEPTTLLEIAREHMQAFFDKPAQRRDSYGRVEGAQNLADLIKDAVVSALGSEFKQVVADARAAVQTQVKTAVANALATELSKLGRN